MTTQELNRDTKRLVKKVKAYWAKNEINSDTIKEIEKEFMRLYLSDPKAEYFNRNMLASMIRINITYTFVPLNTFFIGISL